MSRKLLRLGLIPGPHDAHVRQVLQDCVKAAGWTVADQPPSGRIRKPTLVITPWTPWMTAPSQLVADVILSPDPAGAVQWAEAQGLAEYPHSLALATDWLATAAAMGPEIRVLGPRQLAAGVTLAEGLALPPLVLEAGPNTELQAALDLYSPGRPDVGDGVEWPVPLMRGPIANAKPGQWVPISGPALTFAYGPFYCLSPGQWRLRLAFDMDADAAQLDWLFDWGAGSEFVSLRISPGRAGRYEAVLERAWDASAPAQARMILTESALTGRVRLVSIRVERIA